MSSDRTQQQAADEIQRARELSLESSRPPSQIPGYKLQQFIGSGAYGEVWSATDLKTGRQVAVKFYTRRSNADVQLLAQEVQKLVVLSNDSYVVGLLDVGWDANPPYYVMDYIESGSLEDRLKQGTGMPVSEAVELFQEVATGMMLLHGKGILHCDLKPGNVLLDQNGKPRVADFGQARLKTDETPALGTLFYMAPEQADMSAIPDAGWDVYGLGALLFSMLTGKPPFYSVELAKTIESSEDIGQRLEKYRETLMSAPLPTEHRQVAGVDRGLAEIIDKCIAADPNRRYSNVQSVLLALRQRELVRARRPLMLLGLIAPVLLITVVCLFGWRAFGQAMTKTKEAVIFKAQESNDYAAQLAAQSAAEQVEEYFRVVGQLARDKTFLDTFDKLISDDALKNVRMQLADPKLNSTDGVESNAAAGRLRNELKENGLRLEMQQVFLKTRMEDRDNEFPVAASWFVCDRYGNQIASVFDDDENRTLGCNYSYRTYFTGKDRDGPTGSESSLDHESLSSRPIISEPHLSAVFQSKQSETWKVAFSSPIIRGGEIQGIVAVTVNLGNLIEFNNTETQYVMLVDDRANDSRGAMVLHHPLFAEVLENPSEENVGDQKGSAKPGLFARELPESLAKSFVVLSAEQPVFVDPLGETKLGKQFGYDRESIVSVVDVTAVKHKRGGVAFTENTGLKVLAVQDYQNILFDVNELGYELRKLAAMAGMVAMGLVLSMLLFVNRMLRESRERLARVFSPSTDSAAFLPTETLAVDSELPGATTRPLTDGPTNLTRRSAGK